MNFLQPSFFLAILIGFSLLLNTTKCNEVAFLSIDESLKKEDDRLSFTVIQKKTSIFEFSQLKYSQLVPGALFTIYGSFSVKVRVEENDSSVSLVVSASGAELINIDVPLREIFENSEVKDHIPHFPLSPGTNYYFVIGATLPDVINPDFYQVSIRAKSSKNLLFAFRATFNNNGNPSSEKSIEPSSEAIKSTSNAASLASIIRSAIFFPCVFFCIL